MVLWVLGMLSCEADSQQFSIRHDFTEAEQPESGIWMARTDTSYTLVEQGYSTTSSFVRICFVTLGSDGNITELSSHGRDSLSVQPGWANGPTLLPNGDVLLAGTNYDGNRNTGSAWRFSQQTDSLWAVEIFPDTADESAAAAIRARSSNCYAVGSMSHAGTPVRMFLAMLDLSGNVTWTHEYVGSLRADGFTIDTARVDDGLVLGGRNTINTDDWNGCIIKVDQFGSEQWRRYLGGPFRDGRANVIATTDSAYVSVGAYAGYQSTVSTSSRLYAAKLDMGGGWLGSGSTALWDLSTSCPPLQN